MRNPSRKTTSFQEIRNLVDDISEALLLYQEKQDELGFSSKQRYMMQILNTFDGIIKIYANQASHDAIKDDYLRLSKIHRFITQTNNIDALRLVLLNTDALMERIKVIFNSSADGSKDYFFTGRRRP